jgi:hypothetical protein
MWLDIDAPPDSEHSYGEVMELAMLVMTLVATTDVDKWAFTTMSSVKN